NFGVKVQQVEASRGSILCMPKRALAPERALQRRALRHCPLRLPSFDFVGARQVVLEGGNALQTKYVMRHGECRAAVGQVWRESAREHRSILEPGSRAARFEFCQPQHVL